jgi:hypothetical protein
MHGAELRIREEIVEITGGGSGAFGRSDAVKVVERLSIAGGARLLLVAHAGREHAVEVARDARIGEE